LIDRTAGGTQFETAPIGLYFAKLWYDEKLYPLVFTVAALERAARLAAGA
jgi:squalene-hopene/tetraprenyl-beta-curcumene cyclase